MGSGFDSAEFGETRRATGPPGPARPVPAPATPPSTADSGWVTVREASESTGVPMSTIRGWYRRGRVSRRDGTRPGSPLEVRADEVAGLAARRTRIGVPDGSPGDPQQSSAGVLVPLDSWQQLLRQLGNLHEAGRDLAEARERAARAETEARFLRERLADLREQLAASTPSSPPPAPAADPDPVQRAAGMRLVTQLGRLTRPLGRRRR